MKVTFHVLQRRFFQTGLLAAALLPAAAYAQNTITIDDAYVSGHGGQVANGVLTVSGSWQNSGNTPPVTITTRQAAVRIVNSVIANSNTSNTLDESIKSAVLILSPTPVTIDQSTLSATGSEVFGRNDTTHDITITNTTGYGQYPGGARNLYTGRFLHVDYATRIVVEHCSLEQTGGIYILGGQSVRIRYNRAHNIDGRKTDGSGGYRTDNGPSNDEGFYRYQFVQLNQCHDLSGAEIAWNEIVNDPGQSRVEDNINIGRSNGFSGNPIRIHDNYIHGAYNTDPSIDPQGYSGGGIIADGFSDDVYDTSVNFDAATTAFMEIYNNQVVSTGNYGFSIPAGHDNYVHDNRVVSAGHLADGTPSAASYAQALASYNGPPQAAGVYGNNKFQNNLAGLIRSDGTANFYLFDGSDQGNTALDHTPTLADEAIEFRSWAQKLVQNNIAVGNNFLVNPGFETGDLSHWILYDTVGGGTIFPENLGTGVERTGTYHLAMWHNTAYEAYASQIATGYQGASLPSGTYTASAWVQSTGVNPGNGDAVEMYVYQYDSSGGGYMAVPVPTTGASSGDWRQVTIPNIPVSGGKCEVGFHIKDSSGNHWLRADDVQLYDPLVKPGVPAGLKAVTGASGTKKITLSWTKVAGATSYKVYRSSSSGGTYIQVGTSATLSYANTGLTAGTTYSYKVAATNAAGTSGQSAVVSAKAQ